MDDVAEALGAHLERLAGTLIDNGATSAELQAELWRETVLIERALQDLDELVAELRGR